MKGVVSETMGHCWPHNKMNAPKNRFSSFCGASNVNNGSMAKSDCNVGKRAPFGDITGDEKMQPIKEQAASNQKKRSRGVYEADNCSHAVEQLGNSKPTKRCRLSEI